ncbi:MAG: hypothetical protein XD87_0469, partial [candidate division WS6 bacterium 36_33]
MKKEGNGYDETPRVGLEPTTKRLTVVRSTIELSRIIKQQGYYI